VLTLSFVELPPVFMERHYGFFRFSHRSAWHILQNYSIHRGTPTVLHGIIINHHLFTWPLPLFYVVLLQTTVVFCGTPTVLHGIPMSYHRFLWNYHGSSWDFYELLPFCVGHIGGINDLKHLSMRPGRRPPHQR